MSHWLIHWVPTQNYTQFRIFFASPYVQEKVIARFEREEKKKLVRLLRVSKIASTTQIDSLVLILILEFLVPFEVLFSKATRTLSSPTAAIFEFVT